MVTGWGFAEHEERSGDRGRDDDDVGDVADEPVAVGEEVHDVTAGEPGLTEEPVEGVGCGGTPERTNHDRPRGSLDAEREHDRRDCCGGGHDREHPGEAFAEGEGRLMVVAPPFLLMGSPGRLLLRATPRRGLGRPVMRAALSAYRSRTAQVLLHPATVIVIAVVAFPTLYFTDTLSWFLELPSGHLILLTLFLAFGMIGGAPLWSLDSLPRAPPFVVRIVDVFLELQIHAIFGLVLLRITEPMFRWYATDPESWGISRALDQGIAGGLIWSYGELPLIIVLIVTISKWRTSDLRQAKRREAQEDAELHAYNAYLAAKFGKEQ